MITSLRWADPDRTVLVGQLDDGRTVAARVDQIREEWAEEIRSFKEGGGTIAEYAAPAKLPPREVDEIDPEVRALGLVMAAWAGKTPAQLKQAFAAALAQITGE
jgi:hypothetical protein